MTPIRPYNIIFVTILFCILIACKPEVTKEQLKITDEVKYNIQLDLDEANRLSQLPLECIQNPLPYKSGIILTSESDLKMPQQHHPAFYGCFDWHSAVHGHWSLIYLLKEFPQLESADTIRAMLNQNLTSENLLTELEYFTLNKYNTSFERTYGWAWLLKLQEELYTWDDNQARNWYNNIKPLADYISQAYIDYLPKLAYPIRVGEHTNTAFGLSFAYDYACTVEDLELKNMIEKSARRFYNNDNSCPITWEPSGYDFLSSCLQEMDIMRKILPQEEFDQWFSEFLPGLHQNNLNLDPGRIIDRSDGKLVHLDGLNFSRAWCLYALQQNSNAKQLADEHMAFSLDKIVDGDYAGQHWLASFALYAYKCKNN